MQPLERERRIVWFSKVATPVKHSSTEDNLAARKLFSLEIVFHHGEVSERAVMPLEFKLNKDES